MESKPIRGNALIYILCIAVLTNAFIAVLFQLVNSYLLFIALLVAIVIVNIYYLYYVVVDLTLRYKLEDDKLTVYYFWKLRKVEIDLKKVKGYMYSKVNIHGIKLSGIGNDKFAYGRNIIDKIGTTYMFVPSNKNTLYLQMEGISYAVAPKEELEINEALKRCSIPDSIEDYVENRHVELHKDKKFFIPFIIISALIVFIVVNPFVLYLRNSLPAHMPLTFDAAFKPITWGTGKQFAFKQMTYGVLNMIILFCMYYAAYFCAKYDRKTAYRYLYLCFVVVLVFVFLQIRILWYFG